GLGAVRRGLVDQLVFVHQRGGNPVGRRVGVRQRAHEESGERQRHHHDGSDRQAARPPPAGGLRVQFWGTHCSTPLLLSMSVSFTSLAFKPPSSVSTSMVISSRAGPAVTLLPAGMPAMTVTRGPASSRVAVTRRSPAAKSSGWS